MIKPKASAARPITIATPRRPSSCERRDPLPEPVARGLLAGQLSSLLRRELAIRKQDRQQHLVGDDHHRDTERSGERELAHHLDIDERDDHEPERIASSAIAPGTNSFRNECVDAVTPSAPCSVSSFHAFVIWTACEPRSRRSGTGPGSTSGRAQGGRRQQAEQPDHGHAAQISAST